MEALLGNILDSCSEPMYLIMDLFSCDTVGSLMEKVPYFKIGLEKGLNRNGG